MVYILFKIIKILRKKIKNNNCEIGEYNIIQPIHYESDDMSEKEYFRE